MVGLFSKEIIMDEEDKINEEDVTTLLKGCSYELYAAKHKDSFFIGINDFSATDEVQMPAQKIPESLYHLLIESIKH